MSRIGLTLYIHANSNPNAKFELDYLGRDPRMDTLTLDVIDGDTEVASIFLTMHQVHALVIAIGGHVGRDLRFGTTIVGEFDRAVQRARMAQEAAGAVPDIGALVE